MSEESPTPSAPKPAPRYVCFEAAERLEKAKNQGVRVRLGAPYSSKALDPDGKLAEENYVYIYARRTSHPRVQALIQARRRKLKIDHPDWFRKGQSRGESDDLAPEAVDELESVAAQGIVTRIGTRVVRYEGGEKVAEEEGPPFAVMFDENDRDPTIIRVSDDGDLILRLARKSSEFRRVVVQAGDRVDRATSDDVEELGPK